METGELIGVEGLKRRQGLQTKKTAFQSFHKQLGQKKKR